MPNFLIFVPIQLINPKEFYSSKILFISSTFNSKYIKFLSHLTPISYTTPLYPKLTTFSFNSTWKKENLFFQIDRSSIEWRGKNREVLLSRHGWSPISGHRKSRAEAMDRATFCRCAGARYQNEGRVGGASRGSIRRI